MCLMFSCVTVFVCSGAFVDRYESAKPSTTVVNLIDTLEETRTTEHLVAETVHVDDNEYDEDFISGDYELYQPRGKSDSFHRQHHALYNSLNNK